MSTHELTGAMQKGTIDAVVTDHIWATGIGLPDVSKYVNEWPVTLPFPNIIAVNKKKWDSLPADLQQILKDVTLDQARQCNFATVFAMRFAENALEAGGMKIVKPSAAEHAKARALMQPTYDKWIEMAKDMGPAKQLLDIVWEYSAVAKAKKSK